MESKNPAIELTPLSEDEIAKYELEAERIQKANNLPTKVHVVVQINPQTNERVVCYLQEPNYATKLVLMDKAAMLGQWQAGEEMRSICVITSESNPLTYGESPECDPYKMGVTEYSFGLVKRYLNQYKKK
jgi:hypothetical protein